MRVLGRVMLVAAALLAVAAGAQALDAWVPAGPGTLINAGGTSDSVTLEDASGSQVVVVPPYSTAALPTSVYPAPTGAWHLYDGDGSLVMTQPREFDVPTLAGMPPAVTARPLEAGHMTTEYWVPVDGTMTIVSPEAADVYVSVGPGAGAYALPAFGATKIEAVTGTHVTSNVPIGVFLAGTGTEPWADWVPPLQHAGYRYVACFGPAGGPLSKGSVHFFSPYDSAVVTVQPAGTTFLIPKEGLSVLPASGDMVIDSDVPLLAMQSVQTSGDTAYSVLPAQGSWTPEAQVAALRSPGLVDLAVAFGEDAEVDGAAVTSWRDIGSTGYRCATQNLAEGAHFVKALGNGVQVRVATLGGLEGDLATVSTETCDPAKGTMGGAPKVAGTHPKFPGSEVINYAEYDLKWSNPGGSKQCNVLGYEVWASPPGKDVQLVDSMFVDRLHPLVQTLHFKDLVQCTAYEFAVRAWYASGSGPEGILELAIPGNCGPPMLVDAGNKGGGGQAPPTVQPGDLDLDADGVPDGFDNCLEQPNPTQSNLDADALGDVCDTDLDGDGVANVQDNCPELGDPDGTDTDHDGFGDPCDGDDDNDGIPDLSRGQPLDNCPRDSNPSQQDRDEDGVGDACDADANGNDVLDPREVVVLRPDDTPAPAAPLRDGPRGIDVRDDGRPGLPGYFWWALGCLVVVAFSLYLIASRKR